MMKTHFAFAACVLTPLLFGFHLKADAQTRVDFRERRLQMVREFIEQEGIKNERVLRAMRTVPRHEFVSSRLRDRAYHDGALPIGHRQTISPPFVVAYMTETLDPQPEDRVLEIGTGSGYQAAVLSGLVKEVYTIEIVEALGRIAERRLRRLRYDNVQVRIGDGYQGWAEHAPFDKIIVTCSPEDVPKSLIEQLAEGGRMIIPLGSRYQQVFYLYEKQDGELVRKQLIPTLFVPMTGISEENRNVRPDPANPKINNGGFEIDSNDDGRPEGWHYQRQAELVRGDAPEGEFYLKLQNAEPERFAQVLQGMALDGRLVRELEVTLQVKYNSLASGPESYHRPALLVLFYDRERSPIGQEFVGPWSGDSDWTTASATFQVPRRTREAIVRIGLNGGTGTLCADDIRLRVKNASAE